MHKINVSYSEKRPGDFDYSSRSFHVSLEVEIPANLGIKELQDEIHNVCRIAEDAVKAELDGAAKDADSTNRGPAPRQLPARNNNSVANQANSNSGSKPIELASTRQVKYLIDLLEANGYNIDEVMEHYRVNSLCDLNRAQCSTLIDQIKAADKAA